MAELKEIGEFATEISKAIAILGIAGGGFALGVTILKWIFALIT